MERKLTSIMIGKFNMKDFLGNILEIGDEVVLTAPKYRMFTRAKVIAFTPKRVRVQYNNTWNYGSKGRVEEYLSEPKFLVKTNPKYPYVVETSIYKYGDAVYVWFNEVGMIGGASNMLDQARKEMQTYAKNL